MNKKKFTIYGTNYIWETDDGVNFDLIREKDNEKMGYIGSFFGFFQIGLSHRDKKTEEEQALLIQILENKLKYIRERVSNEKGESNE